MITNKNKILIEWAYRTHNGKPNPKSMAHQIILEDILKEYGWGREEIDELFKGKRFQLFEAPENKPLSDADKEELMGTLQDTVNDLQNESDRLSTIKDKTININEG